MSAVNRDVATRTHGQFLAAVTAFGGGKGNHLQKFLAALLGETIDGDQPQQIPQQPVGEPMDLESDRAKEIEAEMDAERDLFAKVLTKYAPAAAT